MSRIGKIARLPKAVREELNRRLEDGEQQNRLVDWLNEREDVQAVLKAHYEGRPINEPNMTAWVQGGYEDWRRQQESLDAVDRMVEETTELGVIAGARRLADRAADMAALALGEQLMAIRRMEDGAEKRRAVLKIVRGLVRLRNSDRACERGQREAAQAERAAEIHQHWAENARRRAQPVEPALKRVWWTEEDEADDEDGGQDDGGQETGEAAPTASSSMSTSTSVSAGGAEVSGRPPSPGYGETSKAPATVQADPTNGALREA